MLPAAFARACAPARAGMPRAVMARAMGGTHSYQTVETLPTTPAWQHAPASFAPKPSGHFWCGGSQRTDTPKFVAAAMSRAGGHVSQGGNYLAAGDVRDIGTRSPCPTHPRTHAPTLLCSFAVSNSGSNRWQNTPPAVIVCCCYAGSH